MYRIVRHDHEMVDTWKAGGSRCIGEKGREEGSYTWTGGGSGDAKETFFLSLPAHFVAWPVTGKRRVEAEMAGLRCHGGQGGRQKCIAACCFGSRQVRRDWGSG